MLEPVAFGNVFIYYCPTCGFYFQQLYGRLSPPLTNPPRELVEKLSPPRSEASARPSIRDWNVFLTQVYGLPIAEYRKLPKEEKEKIRELYRKWLKGRLLKEEVEKLKKGSEPYITGGPLTGIKPEEVPLFERWLNENLGIGLGDFYDQPPRIQRDLRAAFRSWLREKT